MLRKQIVAVVLLCVCAQSVLADSYDQAFDAYQKGDYQRAMEIWSSSELKKDPRALFGLGRMHMGGELPNSDPARAVDYYTKAANLGHLSAQFNLGLAYYVGNGVEKNMQQAVYWWESAANNGHGSAQYNLGALLWAGVDVPKDQATAMKWFRASLHNDNPQAAKFLYSLFEPMYNELKVNHDRYRQSSAGRTISIIEEMGMFKLGQQAADQGDFGQAIKYWQPLAADGHRESQYMIGTMYEAGHADGKDFADALRLYERAAAAGQPDAQYRMALYHESEAPDPNETLALYWYQSAADNGHEKAREYLETNR